MFIFEKIDMFFDGVSKVGVEVYLVYLICVLNTFLVSLQGQSLVEIYLVDQVYLVEI